MNARPGLLLVCVLLSLEPAGGAISITDEMAVFQPFGTVPVVADWSTAYGNGFNGSVNTDAELDAAVQLLSAVSINTPLAASATQPPSQYNFARWNQPGQYVQIRNGNIAYTALMATLQNDSGHHHFSLFVSYDFGGGLFIIEQVPGWRAYFSLSGAPGSWQNIPALNTTVPGSYSAAIDLGFWSVGSPLYLLWAHDNSTSGSDGYYTLDNFFASVTAGLSIVEPASGQTFVEGANIPVTASGFLAGTLTNFTFFLDGAPVGSATTPPFHTTLTGVTLGQHQLIGIGWDDSGNSSTSPVVQFIVTTNLPAIRVLPGGGGVQTFDYYPPPRDGWRTLSVPGSFSDITNAAGLDALVQTFAASNINTALRQEHTLAPDGASIVSWHAVRNNLISRTTGNRCCLLLAVLQNHTGTNASYLEISYDFDALVTNVLEDVPGLRAYRSLSGEPGSWQLLPGFTADATGHLSVGIKLGAWPVGANLFLLWADDNSPSAGQEYAGEGAYYLDNFSATLQPSLSITLLSGDWVELSWSEAATGFQLEVSDMPAGGTWTPVLDHDEPSDGRHRVVTGGFLDAAFFRLAKP